MVVTKGRIGVLMVGAALGIFAGVCSSGAVSSSGASCKAILKFRHRVYLGTAVRIQSLKSGRLIAANPGLRKIGVAVQPACIDTNNPSPADVPERFQVARIEGVSPTIAIVMLRRRHIYVRPGVEADRGSIDRLIQPKGRPTG